MADQAAASQPAAAPATASPAAALTAPAIGTPTAIKKWAYPFQRQGVPAATPPKPVEVTDPAVYFTALATAQDGFYPIGANGLWHGGIHFDQRTAATLAQDTGVRCIADGEVIAYRIDSAYPGIEYPSGGKVSYSRGFVLVKHRLQLPPKPKATAASPGTVAATATPSAPAPVATTPAATRATGEEPSLTLFSLYMHLLDWAGYAAKPDLARPTCWADGTRFVVGSRAGDPHPYATPTSQDKGLNVRQGSSGATRKIGWLPPGTRLTVVAGTAAWRKVASLDNSQMAADPIHVAAADAPLGWVFIKELDPAAAEPKARDSIVILDTPVPVKAGALLGYLGHYGRHADRSALATGNRPLVHVEVFSGDDVPGFLDTSRARGAELDARHKSLLVIDPGTTLVLPAAADQTVAAGVQVRLTADSPKAGQWAKVQALRSTPAATPKPAEAMTTAPVGAALWVERTLLGSNGQRISTATQMNAWSQFPLQAANATGPTANHVRMANIKTLSDTATDDQGVHWWQIDVDTPDAGGNMLGWACETGRLQSPWQWPGFAVISETSQLADLHGKQLTDDRLESAHDKDDLKAKADRAREGALFQALYDRMDLDADQRLTTDELRAALNKPWLAQTLSRVIARYESEWGGEMAKWHALDGHMGESVDDWSREKERIKDLQWWSELNGRHGFPASATAYHFHPVGLVGNFANRKVAITVEMLQKIFNARSAIPSKLQGFVDEINSQIDDYKLDTPLRLSHFFAQVREEAGAGARTAESFDYDPEGLKKTFSYFRNNPEEAQLYGRTSAHAADQEAIANRAYSNREGHGAVSLGEGWKYRGRGLKQLTWKGNYQSFQDNYSNVWPGESQNFLDNPDLLLESKDAVRSAVYFWLHNDLYLIADKGPELANVDAITGIINLRTRSYQARRDHFTRIWPDKVFEHLD